jgi:hypothetical protein
MLPTTQRPTAETVTSSPGMSPIPAQPGPTATPGTPPSPAEAAAPPPAPAQVTLATPGPEFTVGGGPYTVPIAITNASRLSLMTVSLTYNPGLLRVRSVQQGSFFNQGGVQQVFNQNINATEGRVDISVSRGADQTGATGTGLLASLVVEAIAPGTATFSLSGVGAMPDGRTVPVTFVPATVTVK